jgi:hypothetical protein
MKVQSPTDRKRTARRRKLVGNKGVNKQEDRRIKGNIKAYVKGALIPGRDPKTEVAKETTRQVQKRMAEYRKGKNVIDKVVRYKNPLNK